MAQIKLPHGKIVRKITGAFGEITGMIVALVFLQALIGIDFNFLAQLGNLCKNLFQDIFVMIWSDFFSGYHRHELLIHKTQYFNELRLLNKCDSFMKKRFVYNKVMIQKCCKYFIYFQALKNARQYYILW